MSQQLRFVKKVEGLNFWVLSNQTLGISFEGSIFDLDLHGTTAFLKMSEVFRGIKGITVRMEFRGFHERVFIEGHKRSNEMADYGAKRFSLFWHFETRLGSKDLSTIDDACERFLEIIPLDALQRMGFYLRNLELEELPAFLIDPRKPVSLIGTALDFGDEYVSVLKLQDPKEQIPTDLIDLITKELPCPFTIRIQIRTPESAKVAMQLQLNVKRESTGGLFSSTKRFFSNREALEKLEMEGIVYHAFEWHLVLIRSSLESLKLATNQAYEVLSRYLGDVLMPSVEQYPSLLSTELGANFHSGGRFDFGGLLEAHTVLPYFLPVALRGAWRPSPAANSLGVHRSNHSIDFLNLFDPSYKSYSTVIVGDTGFGKSVFLSQLIRSLHFDEKTKIIVIDVKGSNRRVVESLNGDLFNISLNESTGFNPFATIKVDGSEDTLNILKEFVASLCLEEAETALTEKLSAVIGIALKAYAKAFKKADLKEFIDHLPKDFERLPHLKRFTEGIESKVFQSRKGEQKARSQKLTYYYLEKIETATNRSLRKAMVNAVLMDFYLLLRTKAPDEKVIFICDEAPFFIQDVFSIFAMLIKTMRSQKGALVLAVQYSANLVVHHNHIQDESLINQAATKILFNADGDKELFKSRFKLSESEYELINSNHSQRGQYSQFLIKDTNGPRIAKLYLTDAEFWESGTDGVELAEILNLKAIFPELNEREVALILSEARARGRLHERRFEKAIEQEAEA